MEIYINAGDNRHQTFFTYEAVDDRYGEKGSQIALLFNRKSVMSGTFAILIIFYKVLLRKPLMSSSAEKK